MNPETTNLRPVPIKNPTKEPNPERKAFFVSSVWVISPMNAPEGFARQEATTTTAAVSYAKAGNVTTTDVITRATIRRAPKSSGRILKATVTGGTPKSAAQGRALKTSRRKAHYSPVICTARVPTIPTQNVV